MLATFGSSSSSSSCLDKAPAANDAAVIAEKGFKLPNENSVAPSFKNNFLASGPFKNPEPATPLKGPAPKPYAPNPANIAALPNGDFATFLTVLPIFLTSLPRP